MAASEAERDRRRSDEEGARSGRASLAEDRTEWAERRTLLSKERTFAAWIRTGLAAIAVGFGAAQLLVDVEPRALVLGASLLLVSAGIMAVGIGAWSFRDTLRALERSSVRGIPLAVIGIFTAMIVVVGLIAFVLVLRL
jgi:putative membrane protein